MVKAKRSIPRTCHCGSGKLPGIMREHGWCCGECFNDFHRCPGAEHPDRAVVNETLLSTNDPNQRDMWQRVLRALDAQAQRTAHKATVRGIEG